MRKSLDFRLARFVPLIDAQRSGLVELVADSVPRWYLGGP